MRRTATVATLAMLLAAGCGGGGGSTQSQTTTAAQSAPAVTTTAETTRAEATTTTHTTASHSIVSATSTSGAPLKPTGGYTCNGKRLRALSASGPVKVEPAVVKPGQSFTVTVTDRSAKVADVTLTGVATTPILAHGVAADDGLAARLKMPSYATCGNKLLEVEGDVSAEAYVGVSR